VKFLFDGNRYAIVFGFPKQLDTRWQAHANHDVRVWIDPMDDTHAAVRCETCGLRLNESARDRSRPPRLVRCMIWRVWEDRDVPAAAGADVATARALVSEASARCHPKEQWTRERGKIAALRNALLPQALPFETAAQQAFRAAAFDAYRNRARGPRGANAKRIQALARERDAGGAAAEGRA
jgi:hypothetical protein